MRMPYSQESLKVNSISDSTKSVLVALFTMTLFTILLLTTSARSYAGNHCCMLDELDIVTSKGVESVGYRAGWISEHQQLAKQAYKDDEHNLARRLWTVLANEGDTDSAFKLGMMYDTADSVKYDAKRAVYWYRRAAEQGNTHAQHNLAVAYANGEGVELNIAEAIKWWQKAAQQGNSDSQYNLGIIYAMGSHGIKRNIAMAKRWWRKAAISGDALAQYNLGTLYANGDGQIRSYCEATRWWEKSATAGVKQASWALEVIKTHSEYSACW